MDFEVGIVPLDGEVVIDLRGDLDETAGAVLNEQVRPMTGRYDADQMTIDCTDLGTITDGGIDALIRIGMIPRGSGRLRLADATGRMVAALIDRPEAAELFELVDDHPQSAAGA